VDRRQGFSHTGIQLGEPVLQGSHQIQMHLEQSAVVIADASVQGLDQLGVFLPGVTPGRGRK
jgi:hypothetical protein